VTPDFDKIAKVPAVPRSTGAWPAIAADEVPNAATSIIAIDGFRFVGFITFLLVARID
jgi:hypothetical protein